MRLASRFAISNFEATVRAERHRDYRIWLKGPCRKVRCSVAVLLHRLNDSSPTVPQALDSPSSRLPLEGPSDLDMIVKRGKVVAISIWSSLGIACPQH